MTVSIKYLSGGLFVAQIETVAPEAAASDQFILRGPARLLDAWGVMTGAGATSDTITIKKNTTAVSDVVDVSAKLDKAYFAFGTLDDAQMDFNNGDAVFVDSASDATARVTMLFASRQATP